MNFAAHLTFDQCFNLAEGLLWVGIAGVILVRTLWSAGPRRLGLGAALTFAIFGMSDFIEVVTGAWYAPWPLALLKAACVVSLFVHLVIYIAKHGKRVAELRPPATPKRKRGKFGCAKGTGYYMAPDFDAPLDDFKDYM